MGSEHEFHMEKPLAEMVGTFAMVFIGCGAIMVHETQAIPNAHLNVCLCFGLVIMVMVYACGHISGAHFNPAVTLAFAATKKFPWREVPYYILGQLVGAVLASVILFQLLGPVSHLGSTIPQVVPFKAFIMEIILAFFLMWVITAVATDHRAEGQMAGLAIGGTVALAALMGGPISGASMNPARSFAPALVDGDLQYLWIYVAGPIIGAYLGALCYHKVSRARTHEEFEIEASVDMDNIETKADVAIHGALDD